MKKTEKGQGLIIFAIILAAFLLVLWGSFNFSAGPIAEGLQAEHNARATQMVNDAVISQQAEVQQQTQNAQIFSETQNSIVRRNQIINWALGIGGGLALFYGMVGLVASFVTRHAIRAAKETLKPISHQVGTLRVLINVFDLKRMVVSEINSPGMYLISERNQPPVLVEPGDSDVPVKLRFAMALEKIGANQGRQERIDAAGTLLMQFAESIKQLSADKQINGPVQEPRKQ